VADVRAEMSANGPTGEPVRPELPDLAEQLRLVAWLRWRSLRNGLRNKNRRMDLLGIAVSGLFSSFLVIGITIGLFVGTKYIFDQHKGQYLSLIFLGLLVWWQLFPILLAGFAPQFSFKSLLRFPLNFSTFYLVGLAYGLADAAAVAAVIWMAAMIAGTLVSQPSAVPAMLLVCALFAAMNVTIERLLGAWLEKLLSKRRSREALFGLFILFMVSLQFLNPLLQKHGSEVKALIHAVLPYLWLLPSSFAGDFVARASEGRWSAGLLELAGLMVYALIFSWLLWRRYAKLYAGEELSEGIAPAAKANRTLSEDVDDTDSLGFLPPQVGAVFRKELRYLKRNSFLFFSLVIPPLMVFFFSMQIAGSRSGPFRKGISPDMFFPGMMAYLVLILIAPSYNSFAHESRGIQSYFMSPVRFREILLGKNLMTVVIVFVELVLCVILVGVRGGFPSAPVLLATLMAMIFSVVGQLTIANWSSISFPKKMDFGKMQGQRNSGMSVFLMFGVQLVLGGISALILFSGRWTDSPWLPAQLFTVLAAAAIGGYFASLDSLTHLAEAKKEVLIETLCR
jgi:ABC-2 type transport system permease protein